MTNAVSARCESIELILGAGDDAVRIEVYDDAAGVPQVRHPSPSEPHGRGLVIVAALAADWGVEASATGKRIWAELALT